MSESDHKGISIELNESNFVRGPGYWRFNNSLLKDKDFVEKMNEVLENISKSIEHNPIEKWEFCKLEIRDFCIEYGKEKARKNRNDLLDLLNEVRDIEKQLITNPNNENLQKQLISLKQKIEIIQVNKAKGAQTRARVKWIEEGEKNTRFFCNLEKSRAKKNTITRLEKDTGETIVEQNKLLEEQVSFYKNLYNQKADSNNIAQSINNFIGNVDFPKLTEQEAASCEGLVTLKEASEALAGMKNGSAPGRDGISIEFMKFFWNRVGPLVTDSFVESFTREELSYSQRQGVIILLHKGKDLSREKLSNWRPITLTNTDYKILAKTLTLRLSCVIQKLISEDQVGYLKGRDISTVIRTIDDTLNYINETGKAGYLLALDFSKAFDSVSKQFLQLSFSTFGFGEEFRKWIKILNTGTSSCINHGGWLSESFNVSCGIRQGCPFSPLAFILAVELLAIKIRNCDIKGIDLPIGNTTLKIKQLADDTTLFLKNKEDIKLAEKVLNAFASFSGLQLNNQKTNALRLGSQKHEPDLPYNTVNELKILGIKFKNNTMAKHIEENWADRIKKLQTLIKHWSNRDLSLHGKTVVVKTFLVSQFDFVLKSIGLPQEILQKVNTILYKFIWQRKHSNKKAFEKLKRKTLQNNYENGGLKMIDMIFIQKCYNLQWAGKLYQSNQENWSLIPRWHLAKILSEKGVFEMNCNSKQAKKIDCIKNAFWREVITTYLDTKSPTLQDEVNESNFTSLILYNNNLIKFKNKVLFFEHWKKRGIEKVRDVINFENNRLNTLDEIQSKLTQNRAVTIFEYNALINALPQTWKNWINENNRHQNIDFSIECEALVFNNKPRMIKKYLKDKEEENTPNAYYFWQRKLGVTIDKQVWSMPREATKEVRLLEMQWKIIHNLYPTNILLQKMKVCDTNKCSYCPEEVDFLEHFFYNCQYVKRLWSFVENKLSGELGKHISLSLVDVLFGIRRVYLSMSEVKYINLIVLLGKMSISIAKKTRMFNPIEIVLDQHLSLIHI